MAYSVNNIIPVNVLLEPGGLSYANFASIFFFGTQADLQSDVTFDIDTYRDYSNTDQVLEDFTETSPVYLAARRWFAQIPSPQQFSVWMWDDTNDSPVEAASKANDNAWRYFYRFPNSVADTESEVTALADWMDANTHFTGFITDSDAATDPQDETDLGSVLSERGNRHIIIGYREPDTISDDESQKYADVQLMAAFQKFVPEGFRTAITGEYQVLPGVVGESLKTTSYNALKDKNIVFWTEIELQGSTDASRTINSKTPSSYKEFMDDVINVDVLVNRLQVDGYNYIAGTPTKRPYTPRGYAGLLATLDDTARRFYDNGVLGRNLYTDPRSGEEEEARYGYVIFSDPGDVLDATKAQKNERRYPPVSMLALLARAGHVAEINLTVE